MAGSWRFRGIALIPVVAAIAVSPSDGQGQVHFRAAVVYGDGVERPFALHADTSTARCLWWFTYNFYASRAAGAADTASAVTISFLTPGEWQMVERNGGAGRMEPSAAAFHTRLLLAPLTDSIIVQYRKERYGDFITRLYLHPAAEPYLARHGIPTRLDSAGRPLVRQFAPEELTAMRAEVLRGLGGDHLPECSY